MPLPVYVGCDVSRLRDFIVDFCTRDSSAGPQVVDNAFCAFVWSVVVQQPGICVGTIPEGIHSEVYIAPQLSAKRKGKAEGAEDVGNDAQAASLVVIPDSAIRPLEDLKREFGDGLRIAVDPETSFRAITGSHTRVNEENSSAIFPLLIRAMLAGKINTYGVHLLTARFAWAGGRYQCC